MTQYNDPNLASPTTGGELAIRFDRLVDATQSTYAGANRPTDMQPGGLWVETAGTLINLHMYDGTLDQLVKSIDTNDGTTSTPEAASNRALIDALTARVDALEVLVERHKFPIGSILCMYTDVNPVTALGYGSWSLSMQNRVMIGAGSSYALGAEGGSANRSLSEANIPSHRHQVAQHSHQVNPPGRSFNTNANTHSHQYFRPVNGSTVANGVNAFSLQVQSANTGSHTHSHTVFVDIPEFTSGTTSPLTSFTGSGSSFSLLNPYRAVNFWRRTA